jgi:hypothetical protein
MSDKNEKRNEIRTEKKLFVNVSGNSFEGIGLAINISSNGMFVESPEIFFPPKKVSILIAASEELIELEGEVKWTVKYPMDSDKKFPGGMGIRIIEPSIEYLDFIENLAEEKM